MLRETGKGRVRRRVPVVLLLVVVAVAMLGLATEASALPGFNVVMNGIGPCDSCHPASAVHPPDNTSIPGTNTNHAAVACATCHVNGIAEPPTPPACVSCHAFTAIMTESPHINEGCSSTPGCHGVPNPEAAKVTIAVSPRVIKLRKTVTVSGVVTPASLTVSKVALTVQRKAGTKWVQAKVGAATRQQHARQPQVRVDVQAWQEGVLPGPDVLLRERRGEQDRLEVGGVQRQVT